MNGSGDGGFAGFEVVEKRRALSGTPGRAPLIMDRSPVSCVRSSAGLIEVFSPRLHETVKKKNISLPPIDFKMSKLKP